MRLGFNRRDHFQEGAEIVARHAARDGALEIREVTMDLARHATALRRRRDDERAAIGGADVPPDQCAIHEPIENTRQRRPLVREPTMQIGDGRGRLGGKLREDVRLALRQAELPKISEIEADPVCRAMDVRNQT